jgi:hypothetical protein
VPIIRPYLASQLHFFMSSLQSCPLEVLTLISGFLEKSDLISLSQTSTIFYNICVPQLWVDLVISKPSPQRHLHQHQLPVVLSTLASSSIRSITIPVANLTALSLNHFIGSLLHLDLPNLNSITVSFCKYDCIKTPTFNNSSFISVSGFQSTCENLRPKFQAELLDFECSTNFLGGANLINIDTDNTGSGITSSGIGGNINANSNISISNNITSSSGTHILVNALFSLLGIFLANHPTVRLCIDSTSIHALHNTLLSSTTAAAIRFKQYLKSLTIESLQTVSSHSKLVSVLQNLGSLEHLSITSMDNEIDFDEDEEEEEYNEVGAEGVEIYEINKLLYTSAIAHMYHLKSLSINSTSLLEAFSPESIPASVKSLELESNYTISNSSPASFSTSSSSFSASNSLRHEGTAAMFNKFWFQFLSHNFSHLTSLKVGLWASDLFSYGITQSQHQPSFYMSQSDLSLILSFGSPTTAMLAGSSNSSKLLGNLQHLHIEGDFMPPGLDTVLFASNPNLETVAVPIIYEQGAQVLAATCCHSLKQLTISGNFDQASGDIGSSNNGDNNCSGANTSPFSPQPCFVEVPGALPLLAKCYRLESFKFSVIANTLLGTDMLQFLQDKRTYAQNNSHHHGLQQRPLRVVIEQTDYDLPYYREVISEEEYDEYGGFSMLPLDRIKARMPTYELLRTRFAPAPSCDASNKAGSKTNISSGIEQFVRPIDEDLSTRSDPKYKEYYRQVPFVRYNCIFVLDTEAFERSSGSL